MRTKMPKIKIERGYVNNCCICDLSKKLDKEAETARKIAGEKYPDAELHPSWSSEITDNHTVPGYNIAYIRPATERELHDYWNTDNGMFHANSTQICSRCYETIVKCFERLGDAEEIAFATKESYKEVSQYVPEEFIVPEVTETEE